MKVLTGIEATGPVLGLGYASSIMGADVVLETSDTWYDCPSVSLSAGTWLVMASAFYRRTTTTGAHVTIRISDGTTHYASAGQYHVSAALTTFQINCSTIITLGSTTTIKLQAVSTAGTTLARIQRAVSNNGAGNNATQINAVRLV